MKKVFRPGSRFVEIFAVELSILLYYLLNYANVLSLEKVHSKEFSGYSPMVNLHRIKALDDFRIN